MSFCATGHLSCFVSFCALHYNVLPHVAVWSSYQSHGRQAKLTEWPVRPPLGEISKWFVLKLWCDYGAQEGRRCGVNKCKQRRLTGDICSLGGLEQSVQMLVFPLLINFVNVVRMCQTNMPAAAQIIHIRCLVGVNSRPRCDSLRKWLFAADSIFLKPQFLPRRSEQGSEFDLFLVLVLPFAILSVLPCWKRTNRKKSR